MISLNLSWIYGMEVGITFADSDDCEEFGMNWAVTLSLFILNLTLASYKE